MTDLVEEIAVKSASLPSELQREVLDFVDFVARKRLKAATQAKTVEKRPPFRTARGIMKRDVENLESDLTEVRQEMWHNFPREESE